MEFRQSIGCEKNDYLLLSVGEVNKNKNHAIVIKTLGDLAKETAREFKVHYAIAGKGVLQEELKNLAGDFEIGDRIHFLGFRSDIKEWYAAADLFVFPSYREGLSVSLMEAMASGLPCVVSEIRGNTDLIDRKGGRFFEPNNLKELKSVIKEMLRLNRMERKKLGEYNRFKIMNFELSEVTEQNKKIYQKL